MVENLLLGPGWFFWIDVWTDVFSIIVLALIAFFITKAYQLTKSKRYLVFIVSMYMLIFAFLCKVASSYFTFIEYINGPGIFIDYPILMDTPLFIILFFTYELLTIVGFYFLYHVYNRQESTSTIVLVTILLSLSVFLSYYFYHVFHFVSLIILILISAQYWDHYMKTGLGNAGLLATSFSIIALGQLTFILTSAHSLFYVVAEAIQLVGYLLLLVTFIMVLSHGKKKEQARHNR